MKILVHGINFHPEPTGIGKYTGEMCERLVAMGHEVRVVTAPPYYPGWKVEPGWRNAYTRHTWKGVEVWRTPLWVPAQPTGLTRVLHLLSFSLTALPVMLRQALWRPDVVMAVAPALFCAPWAGMTARLCGARAWLHVQDFEVDAAFELGLLRGNSWKRRVVTTLERVLLRSFDRVSTISHRMLDRTRDKGVSPDRLVFLPNWVDDQLITPLQRRSRYRDVLDLPDDAVVAMFSGTMGGKQGLDMLPVVARQLAVSHPKLVLVLCGDGVVKPQLEAQCAGLANVRMLPLQPAAELNELLGMADIHLLPQHPGAADLVMPSKLTGMLASGRPVVTTTVPGTELERMVRECGRVVPPGDADAFAQALADLADQPLLRKTLGTAARLLAEQQLAQGAVLQRLEACLLACANHSTSGVELPWERQHNPRA